MLNHDGRADEFDDIYHYIQVENKPKERNRQKGRQRGWERVVLRVLRVLREGGSVIGRLWDVPACYCYKIYQKLGIDIPFQPSSSSLSTDFAFIEHYHGSAPPHPIRDASHFAQTLCSSS